MSSDFCTNIKSCVALLTEIDFLAQVHCMTSLNVSPEFKSEARRGHSYRHLYSLGMRKHDYNFVIKDNAFFQFYKNDEPFTLRYAYYPNPNLFIQYQEERKIASDWLENGEIDEREYDQLLAEDSCLSGDTPPIRYDVSYIQYNAKYHPTAHFHIGTLTENRWPVRRILSPYAFLLAILKHYYVRLWIEKNETVAEEFCKELDTCEILSDEYFTESECKHLHFT